MKMRNITGWIGILILFFGAVPSASADSSGPLGGAAFSTDSSVGTELWSNANSAILSDNQWASAVYNTTGFTTYLTATDFGFSIPSGSTINGITVEVER